jgi:hypothetical protein
VTHLLQAVCRTRTHLLVLLLVMALVVPEPAPAQFPIDWAPVVTAIGAIASAITNIIGPGLRLINTALTAANNILGDLNNFFHNVVYPADAIARAQALVGQVRAVYAQIRAIANAHIASASLPNPQSLEAVLLSRDPLNIPNIAAMYQNVYQAVPAAGSAPPQTRDMIDMTDAIVQDAMKRAVEIDAIADIEQQAAASMEQELQAAAPGTAPMVEAEAAAWLVRANANTQSALSEVIRMRAIALANSSAQMKTDANNAGDVRQNSTQSFQ